MRRAKEEIFLWQTDSYSMKPLTMERVPSLRSPQRQSAEATGEKYREIARAMGVKGVDDMTQEEYRKAAVDAVRQLSIDVGIPTDLKDIVKPEDIPFLAQSAYDDACRPGNPKETSVEDITKLYESLI